MSGYDTLDELYERLREAEDARRAGGITPEAIRVARGGVVDENGRTPATAAENAADGDSAPLADISRDTRARIEADAWDAARLDMSRTWEERRDAIVALLDRQAALTEREVKQANMDKWRTWCESLGIPCTQERAGLQIQEMAEECDDLRAKLAQCMESYADAKDSRDALQAELDHARACPDCDCCGWTGKVDVLRAELDAYDQTHMLLPCDADGVPIRVGDKMLADDELRAEYGASEVMAVDDCNGWVGYDGVLRYADESRHVAPRTVESVLSDLVNSVGTVEFDALTAIREAAAEIRELMEVGE